MSQTEETSIKVINRVESLEINERKEFEPLNLINIQPFLQRYIRIKNQFAREFIAEVLGTFVLLFIGLSSVAQFKFFSKDNPYSTSFLSVNIAFGFGCVVAILITGKVSGAHLNPAVSLAMFLTGRLSCLKLVLYTIAQVLGAFLGACLVFVIYYDMLSSYKDQMFSLDTAGIFATYPNPKLSIFGGFLDQVVGTTMLILAILALADSKNNQIAQGTSAIIVGMIVIVIGTSLAYNCGYAINPARDFGPRLFTLVAGWGTKTFETGNYFFWIPIVAPLVGSVTGTLIYLILISNHF